MQEDYTRISAWRTRNHLEGKRGILDLNSLNSSLHGPFQAALNNDPNLFFENSSSITSKEIEFVKQMGNNLVFNKGYFISESQEEGKAYLEKLQRTREEIINPNGPRTQFLAREKKREVVERFDKYVSAITGVLERLSTLDHRPDFSLKEKLNYASYYFLAEDLYQDIRETSIRGKENKRKKHKDVGEPLGTDKHIAATAFTQAYLSPTLVISRDDGLKLLLTRMKEAISHPEVREHYRISSNPGFHISFYGTTINLHPLSRYKYLEDTSVLQLLNLENKLSVN